MVGMARSKSKQLRLEQLNLPQPAIRSGRGDLDALVASISELGLLVPLVVRPLGGEEYAVIAGAGRLEALRRSGAGPRSRVPCVVVEVDDAEAMLLALVENVVREEMRPFDEAEAARVLTEDYGLTQERVASALGITQGAISRKMRVFRLAPAVVAAVRRGDVELAPALALLPLEGRAAAQRKILKRMIAEDLSAPQVAGLVAAERFGSAAIAPLGFTVRGAGKVTAKTTASGRLRVVLDADDPKALPRLWRSLQKKLK